MFTGYTIIAVAKFLKFLTGAPPKKWQFCDFFKFSNFHQNVCGRVMWDKVDTLLDFG
jgi:hypothetical protein